MKKVSIGLLSSTSTITPMSRDFESGLRQELEQLKASGEWEPEIITEFTGQGGIKRTQEAVAKLIDYNCVDIITGIVSNHVGMSLSEKLEKNRTAFLLNNIGEHIPNPGMFNPYMFVNSTNTWQQLWSLSNWAVNKFGNKGMFVSSVYDAGYSFMHAMTLGMAAADPDCKTPFAIAPVDDTTRLSDPGFVIQYIEQEKPDFVLSVFCGEEAKAFLEAYVKSGLHKTTPLLSLPFLLESFDAAGEKLDIYTTAVSTTETDNVPHELYPSRPFISLGIEAGKLIAEAIRQGNGRRLHEALNNVNVSSGRGRLHISTNTPGTNTKVHIVKNTHAGDKDAMQTELVETATDTLQIDNERLAESFTRMHTAWENPYLGI